MNFFTAALTDAGNFRKNNQDGILARTDRQRGLLLAAVCDGMGGLSDGELASAQVIRSLNEWFEILVETKAEDAAETKAADAAKEIAGLLKKENFLIGDYGRRNGISLGTTATIFVLAGSECAIVHVGDSRVYHVSHSKKAERLTEDQTLAAREARRGKMTALEAQRDKRRNLLLQCVGASARVEPEIKTGRVRPGIYIICSDGFCNKITDREIAQAFDPAVIESRDDIKKAGKTLIERARLRGEEDNMSFAAVKVAEI